MLSSLLSKQEGLVEDRRSRVRDAHRSQVQRTLITETLHDKSNSWLAASRMEFMAKPMSPSAFVDQAKMYACSGNNTTLPHGRH